MNTTGGGAVMGSFPYPRNGILKMDYEFILIFKKLGKAPLVSHEIKKASEMTKDEWNAFFSSHWNFGGARQNQHMAVFPEELPRRLIKMFSFVGETVLDPFSGSGTTTLAAKNLGRNSIGYEINPEYIEICKDKIGASRLDSVQYDFRFENEKTDIDVQKVIDGFSYTFCDPHKMDKKVDIKKLQFGSRIDDQGIVQREDYYTVKRVINPKLVQLDNDLIVRLIGIEEKHAANGEATKFLTERIIGQKVFMKYDDRKYDEDNHLMCYLYLKNKTFVNAHLIKLGLANVDLKYDYSKKNRFIEMEIKNG